MLLCQSAPGWEYAVILLFGVLLALAVVAAFADFKTRRCAEAARALEDAAQTGEGPALDGLTPRAAALTRIAERGAPVPPESVCVETRPLHGVLGMLAATLTLCALCALPLTGSGDSHAAEVNRMLIGIFGGVTAAAILVIGYLCRRRAHAVYERFYAALAGFRPTEGAEYAEYPAAGDLSAAGEGGETERFAGAEREPTDAAPDFSPAAAGVAVEAPTAVAGTEAPSGREEAAAPAASAGTEDVWAKAPDGAASDAERPAPPDEDRAAEDEVRAITARVAALDVDSPPALRRETAFRLQEIRMKRHTPEDEALLRAAVTKMLKLLES